MDARPPLPFFMTYPSAVPAGNQSEKVSGRDYMRQLYPLEAKQYLAVIVGVLDEMDFRENYIYDEYPDQLTLLRLTDTILRLIPMRNNVSRETQRSLVQVLLYDEIIRRRELNRNL
ncbi:MAG: hypothetical protein ACI4D2_02720 [Lachnospiraceae bacterium]